MALLNTVLSVLPLVAFLATVVGVVRAESRRRIEKEEDERRIYKTGLWLDDR